MGAIGTWLGGVSPDSCPATSQVASGSRPGGWHDKPDSLQASCSFDSKPPLGRNLLLSDQPARQVPGTELHPFTPTSCLFLGCRGCKEVTFSSRMKLPSAFKHKLISLHPTPLRKGTLQGRVVFRSWKLKPTQWWPS